MAHNRNLSNEKQLIYWFNRHLRDKGHQFGAFGKKLAHFFHSTPRNNRSCIIKFKNT